MIKVSYKNVLLYALIMLYVIFGNIIFIGDILKHYNYIINPLMWLLIFILSIYIVKGDKIRVRSKIDKTQTVFIIILFYISFYFISGLVLGFAISPYAHSFMGTIKNLWAFVVIIIFKEYARYSLIATSPKKKKSYILITILFVLVDLNFFNFGSNFSSAEIAFKYISKTIIPAIAKSALLVYLAKNAGYKAALAYTLPIAFVNIIAPIFPDLSWFMSALYELSLAFICFIIINYKIVKENHEETRKIVRKQNPIRNIPVLIFLFVFVLFVAGFFKYMPMAIMSNSMATVINRGDIVVVEKLSDREKKNIKLGEIIEYELDGSTIVHRVVRIEVKNNGELKYTTQGDNNKQPDFKPVYSEQIKARVLFKVPYIGYPVVYINELFNKTSPNVEKGDK